MPEERQTGASADALQELDERLAALRRQTFDVSKDQPGSSSHPVGRMMWLAFNVVSDLIAGVICGLGIGYGLDYWLGTRPVFIAVFLILGGAAGVLNAVRFLQRCDKRNQNGQRLSQGKE